MAPLIVRGTLFEEPPAQILGAGLNTSGAVVIPGGALSPSATINVRFVLGVQLADRIASSSTSRRFRN